MTFAICLFLFQLANASLLPLVVEGLVYQGEKSSSLIVSALIVLPQIVVALMAPWVGRQAKAGAACPFSSSGLPLCRSARCCSLS